MNNKVLRFICIALGVFCCMLLAISYPTHLTTAQEAGNMQSMIQERFLKADGKVLRDNSGKGNVVTLRGTNIGGWQLMEAWMCPTNAPDQKTTIEVLTERFGKEKADELIKVYEQSWWQEQDFDNVKGLNFNVLRLPISCYNLLDENGLLREDTLATYDWFVKECEKRDIYVILDLHAAPGSQNGRDHSGDQSGSKLFHDEAAQKLTISLWEQLAEHFKGNPVIAGYGLLNEPEGSEEERYPWGAVQLPFHDQLYRAIRAVDPDHLIIMNAIWEPTNMPDPSQYGWENVMYEYHYYGWDGIDNAVQQRHFTDAKVDNDNRSNHEVPVLIGEFTLFDKLPSWEYALKLYNEHGWSWTTWTYKTVEMGSWGIYNSSSSSTPKVDIYHDSAEVIEEKWSKVDTATSFKKNKYLYDILRAMSNDEAAKFSNRKWFQNFEMEEVNLRAGLEAEASVVSSSETYSSRKESQAVSLKVTGVEKMPTATSRNVCIAPMIRNSVDVTGMDYLILHTYSKQGNRAIQVTLVDKNGDLWSTYTSASALPIAYAWEKIFVDISEADIDTSAIIEIRIGVNEPGTYYFDDIYFSDSYAALLPEETVEAMKSDTGVLGKVIDWTDITSKEEVSKKSMKRLDLCIIIISAIVLAVVSVALILTRKKHRPLK